MVPPPSALRVSAARRELRLRARPGLRTLVVPAGAMRPAGVTWSVVLRQGRWARAFIATYDRGAA